MAVVEILKQAETLDSRKTLERPIFTSVVHAGFASPADDHIDQKLDLNDYLIKKPAATYFVKVSGDSMIGAGIFPGDTLIVDRSLSATNNSIVIAMVDSEFMVKRLKRHQGEIYLISENSKYPPIQVKDPDMIIWGIVTYTIHKPQ
jgi:DNA polymerase V